MTSSNSSAAAKAIVRRNTEEVQGGGNFEVFEELFADDFVDHTPQPNRTPDKAGARELYRTLRAAFPDFHAEIHWQLDLGASREKLRRQAVAIGGEHCANVPRPSCSRASPPCDSQAGWDFRKDKGQRPRGIMSSGAHFGKIGIRVA